ncbi:exodeoxyribonuclease V subunit gamma [Klebsiella pneumoniae]|nr:exodeoxyribonuclease V subunit gamma [Klebsiella pneumoniae]
MRSIPFKVVCLLGMNDGVYPRTLPPLGFDLMSQKPQRGDPAAGAMMTAICSSKR